MTTTSVESAVPLFGERTKGKLANAGASGQPEDQLRSPFESLLQDMSALTALAGAVEAVGESSVASLDAARLRGDCEECPSWLCGVEGAP